MYRSRFSKKNTRKKALDEIYNIHTPSESNLKTMKSASGKRHPGNEDWRERSELKNPAKVQNFVKHLRSFAVLFSKYCLFCFASVVQNSSIKIKLLVLSKL